MANANVGSAMHAGVVGHETQAGAPGDGHFRNALRVPCCQDHVTRCPPFGLGPTGQAVGIGLGKEGRVSQDYVDLYHREGGILDGTRKLATGAAGGSPIRGSSAGAHEFSEHCRSCGGDLRKHICGHSRVGHSTCMSPRISLGWGAHTFRVQREEHMRAAAHMSSGVPATASLSRRAQVGGHINSSKLIGELYGLAGTMISNYIYIYTGTPHWQ